jgi:hypothetical protein
MNDKIWAEQLHTWLEAFCTTKQEGWLRLKPLCWYRERISMYLAWLDNDVDLSPTNSLALHNG